MKEYVPYEYIKRHSKLQLGQVFSLGFMSQALAQVTPLGPVVFSSTIIISRIEGTALTLSHYRQIEQVRVVWP